MDVRPVKQIGSLHPNSIAPMEVAVQAMAMPLHRSCGFLSGQNVWLMLTPSGLRLF